MLAKRERRKSLEQYRFGHHSARCYRYYILAVKERVYVIPQIDTLLSHLNFTTAAEWFFKRTGVLIFCGDNVKWEIINYTNRTFHWNFSDRFPQHAHVHLLCTYYWLRVLKKPCNWPNSFETMCTPACLICRYFFDNLY